jgi:hypothetical protein
VARAAARRSCCALSRRSRASAICASPSVAQAIVYMTKHATDSATGRRLTKKDIAPQMIAAGVDVLMEHQMNLELPSTIKGQADCVAAVFIAMLAAEPSRYR